MEAKLQSQITKFLREKGAYVITTKSGPGTPTGCPDIIFLFEGAWAAIECKASKTARYQPGQKATLKRLDEWSGFVFVAYPDNWPEIKKILLTHFF